MKQMEGIKRKEKNFKKWKESFTVNSLAVKGFKTGTKYFTSLYLEVFEADKIGQNYVQFSMLTLCT